MEKNKITKEELTHIIAYGFEIEDIDLSTISEEESKALAEAYADEAAQELVGQYDVNDLICALAQIKKEKGE